jgi:hypothetical protein
MASILIQIDDLLRGRWWARDAAAARVGAETPTRSVARYIAMIVGFGLLYGAAMGCFGIGEGPSRLWQIVYSAVKVPLLLLVTFLISLPSFFVLNTLLGVREEFGEVFRGLVASQATITIVLASLAPLTLLFYLSFDDYDAAILFNAAMFALASFAAQRALRRHYRALMARSARHARLLIVWLVLFAFVGIQMGWVLRPFIGNPRRPVQFFRAGAWGNAYVEVVRVAARFVKHR